MKQVLPQVLPQVQQVQVQQVQVQQVQVQQVQQVLPLMVYLLQCFVWPIHFCQMLFVLDCPQEGQQSVVWLQSQQDHWRHLFETSCLVADSYTGQVWPWDCLKQFYIGQGLLC
jgi:hypothetical protein